MWSWKTFKAHLKMQTNPVRVFCYEKSGKKYLAVIHTNFFGPKWLRRFEIVSELDPVSMFPIEFKGIKIDDCLKKQPSDSIKP